MVFCNKPLFRFFMAVRRSFLAVANGGTTSGLYSRMGFSLLGIEDSTKLTIRITFRQRGNWQVGGRYVYGSGTGSCVRAGHVCLFFYFIFYVCLNIYLDLSLCRSCRSPFLPQLRLVFSGEKKCHINYVVVAVPSVFNESPREFGPRTRTHSWYK